MRGTVTGEMGMLMKVAARGTGTAVFPTVKCRREAGQSPVQFCRNVFPVLFAAVCCFLFQFPAFCRPQRSERAKCLSGAVARKGVSLSVPTRGFLYHGVYPGGVSGEESDITPSDVQSYEELAGKSVTWVYFSDNWYEGRQFPAETAGWIRDLGSVPYVRLMLRSSAEENVDEPFFRLQAIIDGRFDDDLTAWFLAAAAFGTPLIMEYGTEMNGAWFPWNGVWNGGGTTGGYGDPAVPDGPERFRDAYRHIIQLSRDAGAENIVWVFHANWADDPGESWNALENYYPGDAWIDWIGVSVYGALTPQDDECGSFGTEMDAVYPRLAALSSQNPIFVAEFGVSKDNSFCGQAAWADAALAGIESFRWPRVMGFSWWNEHWENDDNPLHDTTMRLQDNGALSAVFQEKVGRNPIVLGAPRIFTLDPVFTEETGAVAR